MIKRIVLTGAPGSGKGTWSKILSDRFLLPHISSGDLFRAEMAAQSPLGQEIRSYVDSGSLVPDDLTIQLIKEVIVEGAGSQGFILDGFPRTLAQARALDQILEGCGQKLDLVIDIDVEEPVLIQRALSRFICQDCGQPYNTTTMQPATPDVCDRCGGKVVRRGDDTEETLKRRLAAYQEETAPLAGYYDLQGKRVVFANSGPPDQAAQEELLELMEAKVLPA